MRSVLVTITSALATLAAAFVTSISPVAADDAARARLAGRILNIVGTYENSSSGARYWSVVSPYVQALLPETQIRLRFNGAGGGISAVNELYAEDGKSLSIAISTIPELAFAQTQGAEGVAYDLTKAQWIVGLERPGNFVATRPGLSTDMAVLRQPETRLLSPVDSVTGNGAILMLILNAATGLHAKMVVGFSSAEAQRALVVGDVDLRRLMLTPETTALLETGDLQSLYTISDSDNFPPQVDRTRTLESMTLPGTPSQVIDYVKSMIELGRGVYAAPNQDPEDIAALQSVFAEVMQNPTVLAELATQFAVVRMVPPEEVKRRMDVMLLSAPGAKDAIDRAYSCGMAMGNGTLDACDWSALGQ